MNKAGTSTPQSEDIEEIKSDISIRQRLLIRFAKINGWLIFGGGIVLGIIADNTGSLDSFSWVFYLLAGILPILQATIPTSENETEFEISNRERVIFLVSTLRWAFTPWGIFAQVYQIIGQILPLIRYRGKLPSTERHVPDTSLKPPFEDDDEWTVVNGGVTKETSHSWGIISQRYAYDFVVSEDDESHEGDGKNLDNYYAYGKPICAPAGGQVVKVKDDLRDYPNPGSMWTEWRTWRIQGNYVIIEHDTGEYSMLAHLKEGSVTVSPGDYVEEGEMIGRCGNSGNSTEPHLHYQLQDIPNFWTAAGLPPRFTDVEIFGDDKDESHGVYSYRNDKNEVYLRSGDRVKTQERTETQKQEEIRLA